MNRKEAPIRDVVRDLFTRKKVDLVIGYENGSLPLRSRPCFLRGVEAVDRLVWNSYCANNLAVYLPQFYQGKEGAAKKKAPPPRIGIVAKGCDARSIVGLLKENQVPRENLIIIGIPCTGMVDPVKVEAALEGDYVFACRECPDGMLEVVTGSGGEKKLKREEVMLEACLECRYPSPVGADVMIEGRPKEPSGRKFAKVKEFENKSSVEKRRYFTDELSRCIRCYACRQACPNCYCKVCFADQTKPRWIGAGDDLSDVFIYHIIRVFHQAGRCVGCGNCVRACPVGIDLRLLNEKIGKDVEEIFDYTSGLSIEEPLPLCTFERQDSQSFMTEP